MFAGVLDCVHLWQAGHQCQYVWTAQGLRPAKPPKVNKEIAPIWGFLTPKNAEKCKKYKKNAKKVQNNLHISKKSSTFAP